ncbi:dTDP-4-dehydrorhamnose 3,5-epimerase family protein [Pseudodesulfovibrio pelocollis]|uniref:dTDP-4-dehydrorhamnose 3,5-epimerase family protein n=1 Tax=Pseudodesulfovibrio pelocollis TaxID=3051432 RepID=UPI00255B13EE|nr:dTDP-4-dehydrorhamnose 3,5-epimerase family protein [Pseudodesulfovibrio sp. SB368]
MRFDPLPLAGAYRLEGANFADDRGWFARIYCAEELESVGLGKTISQANISMTRRKGAVRGMHYQHPPHAEAKIIRCLRGSVFDVMVDLREESETYLCWCGEVLTADSGKALLVPEGFAHGFQTLEDDTQLLYMHTEPYAPECEGGIRFDDPAVGIQWPFPPSYVSERDLKHPLIAQGYVGIKL